MRKARAAVPGAGLRGRRVRDDAGTAASDEDPLDPASAYEPPDVDAPHGARTFRGSRATSAPHADFDEPGESAASGKRDDPRSARRERPARSLKARALDYLSRREYSRVELARKLAPHAGEQDSVDALIDSLERDGWLSDARFVESVVHRRAARHGTSRIVNELRRHAVSDTLLEAAGSQLRETEFARAQAVWQKKFGQLPGTPAERIKQARFLAMRGFSHAVIGRILKGDDLACDD